LNANYDLSNYNENIDDALMLRCIELAKKGRGFVSPNPLVGCVIVKAGKIVSEGYHKKFGSHHAEINAMNIAMKKGINLSGTTLYVNLEPCCHHGKTPPCVDRIIENKLGKVVIGTVDPNPLVNGKSIKKLKKNGIRVVSRVLEKECYKLNKFFFKNIKTGLPYVTLKSAQTLDGKIADEDGNSKWISSVESRRQVHRLRTEYDAVLVGRKTVEIDNPQLTVRLINGRNPFHIVFDKDFKLEVNKKIFSDKSGNKTIIITSHKGFLRNRNKRKYLEDRGINFISAILKNGTLNLKDVLKKLYRLGIGSILVEGGSYTFSQFIQKEFVDEFIIFIAPKIFGKGINGFSFIKKKNLKFKEIRWGKSGSDIVVNMKFK
jgi:diaminohydroxyphosphoribosylaminopyrimidine deaminase/5-amino-6-(5-phosphoribosylamino)uracil reductase